MATVTGLTAERMIEMEQATVIDGEIQGDNLVLITRGGTEVDAGDVRGPAGPQGPENLNAILRDGSRSMLAQLQLFGDPVGSNDAVRKAFVDAMMPVGVMLPFTGTVVPAGQWAMCNGASASTSTLAALFAVIAYRFGGSGASFNLPNMAGRTPVGVDPAVTAFDAPGKTGGSANAVLPSHNHDMAHSHSGTTGNENNTHYHSTNGATGGQSTDHYHLGEGGATLLSATDTGNGIYVGVTGGGIGPLYYSATNYSGSDHTHNISLNGGTQSAAHGHAWSASHTGRTGLDGVSATNGNLQPYVIVNYIIRTG